MSAVAEITYTVNLSYTNCFYLVYFIKFYSDVSNEFSVFHIEIQKGVIARPCILFFLTRLLAYIIFKCALLWRNERSWKWRRPQFARTLLIRKTFAFRRYLLWWRFYLRSARTTLASWGSLQRMMWINRKIISFPWQCF